MAARDKAPEIAAAARQLANQLYDYEAAHPESVREHCDQIPHYAAPSIAAENAMELARALTDWAEGRWDPSEEEIKEFVTTKMFEVLATTDACGINLDTDDLLKEAWAATLYASGNPDDANLADAMLSNGKTLDEVEREFRSAMPCKPDRKE